MLKEIAIQEVEKPSKKGQPEQTHQPFDWMPFAQTEIRHLQVIELLESSLEEAERLVNEKRSSASPGAFLTFPFASKRALEQREIAEASLAAIRRRIHEERRALLANEHSLHEALHEWLILHDSEYAVSAELDILFERIDASIVPLVNQLTSLLAHYGAIRNEIAISYDHKTGSLSPSAMASLERLVGSYEGLIESTRIFSCRLGRVNELVEGTMFQGFQQCLFNQAVPPECRINMDFIQLQSNFEAGADQVRHALHQLREYARSAKEEYNMKEKILYKYRETRWQKHLAAMRETL